MAIEFRCSQCNQLLRVSDQSAGKSARCPKCQTTLKVPGEAPAATQPTATAKPSAPANDPFGFPSGGGSPFPNSPMPAPGGFGTAPQKADPFAPSFGSAGGTASNPFGEAKPAPGGPTLGLNPYASPAASASFAPTGMMTSHYGMRPGLPWEQQGGSLGSWWETAKLCMLNPTYAFSIMRQEGGIGSPMMFALVGQLIGAVAAAFWQVVMGVVMILLAGGGGETVGVMALQIVGQVVYAFVAAAMGATIGLLIGAGIMHLFLLIVGAGNKGYEATFRTLAFANGSLAWMQVVPFVGGIVAAIWMLVIQVIGLAKAQETDIGKVIIALVLQIVACMVLIAIPILLIIFAFGAALAGAGAGGN